MKRYILGCGNYTKNDDGIGIRIIEYIVENRLDNGFEAVEIGNDGMRLLTYFSEDTGKILIVDCALMGKPPGEYEIISPDNISSVKMLENISTHEGDILTLIELGKKLEYPIPEIKILAIQPENMEMEMSLSDRLKNQLSEYTKAAIREIMK